MAKSKMRLRFPNIILLLCGLILLIFLFDFLWRNVLSPTVPGDTEGIIVADGSFASSEDSSASDSSGTDDTSEKETEAVTETTTEEATEDPNVQKVTLTQSQIHNGSLILVSGTCPFVGDADFVDFTSSGNSNVKPRDTALEINPEILQPLSNLFDGYYNDNGYVNLQIYSTNSTYTGGDSLYTNDLSERSTGYTFDIGLITSTGDVVAYITKRNEWMFNNCWRYGFVVRYQDYKTGTTGVGYMPHHFRYVGLPHSMAMYENDFCLEEYLQFLTDYTYADPYTYEYNGSSYEIYYVPAEESGDTVLYLPKDVTYSVSGNNTDGFIVTLDVTNSTSSDEPEETTDNYEEDLSQDETSDADGSYEE
ncbi:MAG: D-alanyl-D-alanine carboxypeptidase family protein [Ruminococcus sp.]|nr:D-alanyl-D-alanine carboxypeptidase family protein [Ruminococcus sp.]